MHADAAAAAATPLDIFAAFADAACFLLMLTLLF